MVLPPSRTSAEAHLYLDLHPCSCGDGRFPRDSEVVTLPDGDLATRYTGACAGCGQPREFVFRLTDWSTLANPRPAAPVRLVDELSSNFSASMGSARRPLLRSV